MPEAVLTLVKGDKVGDETDYRDALAVNMLTVVRPILGADGYLLQVHGLVAHAEANGISRGGVWNDRFEDHYRINGQTLYSVAANGTLTDLGAIAGAGLVSLSHSFQSQGIVASGRFYLYSPTDGLTEVTDSDLGYPIDVVWVDGYYFFTDGEFIYHTDISDESSIDPLKFSTAEFMPDKTLGVAKTQDNKVMVFGRYTIEYFVNTATENFAFQRQQTRAIKIGIVGTHCKCEVEGAYAILGSRKNEAVGVHLVTVGQDHRISSREIEKIIAQYSEQELGLSKLETFEENGSTFILVHLPNDTLCLNYTAVQSTGLAAAWTVLKSGAVSGTRNYRAWNLVYDVRISSWTIGDKSDGKIGLMDQSIATQYDEIAQWELYTPYAPIEKASIDQVDIDTIAGFTDTKDAQVFISLTYDGQFWGKEWTAQYGQPGDFGKRFIVRRLGYVRDNFALKMRGATRSRMAFALCKVSYG